jgi:tape measure domain-containing protein
VPDVAELQVVIGADTRGFDAGIKHVQEASKGLGDSVSKGIGMGVGIAALEKGMQAFALGFGAAKGAIIDLNSSLEQSKIAFTTMLGSAEKADDFLASLAKFAAETPFEFPDLVQASKRMFAFGFAAKDVVPLLTAVGDAVAAVGGGADVIDGVTTALGQMQAKGKVSAEEMNQLAERGIPAWDMLAKKMGVSVAQAMDASAKGQVKAATMLAAFQEGAAARFGGMMQKQSKTWQGALSTISDSLNMAMAKAFRPFFDLLSHGAVLVAGFLSEQSFTSWADAVAVSMGDLIGQLSSLVFYVGAVLDDGDTMNDWLSHLPGPIQGVVHAFGELTVWLSDKLQPAWQWVLDHSDGIKAAFAGAAAALATLAAAGAVVPIITAVGSAILALLSPIALVAAAGAALALAWQNNWFGIRQTTATVVDYLVTTVWPGLQVAMATVATMVGWLVTTVWPGLQVAMATVATWIATTLVPTFELVTSWLFEKVGATLTWLTTTAWPTVQTAMATVASWALGTLVPALTGVWSWLSEKVGAALTWLTTTGWPLLGAAANKVQNWIKDSLIPTLTDWYTWFDQKLSPIYTWFTTVGWPKLQEAGQLVAAWITGPLATALKSWYEWLQDRLSPIFQWFTTTGWPTLQSAGQTVVNWIVGPLTDALRGWYEWLQDRLSPVFDWFTTTGWPSFQTAGAYVWTWLTTNMIPAWEALWRQMQQNAQPAAEWWIDHGFPSLTGGLQTMAPEVATGAQFWNDFTAALAKTDAAEHWVAILENFSRLGKYLIENIKLGDWFNDITNGAAAATGWVDYIAEAVNWILKTIHTWSDAFPGQRNLPDVTEPPTPPSGGGGGGGGGGGTLPEPPGRVTAPAPSPIPAPTPPPVAPPSNPPPVAPAPIPPPGSGLPQVGVVPQWGSYIVAASQLTGTPQSVIAAIMDIETGGHPPWESPMNRDSQGRPIGRAQGLMQVMPFHFGQTLGPDGEATADQKAYMQEPTRNVNKGAGILASNFAAHGSWRQAAGYYFGIGTDVGGQTTTGYIAQFLSANAKYGGTNIPKLARGGWAGLSGPELALLGERGPEYVVPNAAIRRSGGYLPQQTVKIDVAIGGRLAEEIYVTGRDLAIRRGRAPAGAA